MEDREQPFHNSNPMDETLNPLRSSSDHERFQGNLSQPTKPRALQSEFQAAFGFNPEAAIGIESKYATWDSLYIEATDNTKLLRLQNVRLDVARVTENNNFKEIYYALQFDLTTYRWRPGRGTINYLFDFWFKDQSGLIVKYSDWKASVGKEPCSTTRPIRLISNSYRIDFFDSLSTVDFDLQDTTFYHNEC
jgi:hypothetical protein